MAHHLLIECYTRLTTRRTTGGAGHIGDIGETSGDGDVTVRADVATVGDVMTVGIVTTRGVDLASGDIMTCGDTKRLLSRNPANPRRSDDVITVGSFRCVCAADVVFIVAVPTTRHELTGTSLSLCDVTALRRTVQPSDRKFMLSCDVPSLSEPSRTTPVADGGGVKISMLQITGALTFKLYR